MSLFTTDWLRAADDDTRRPVLDYGLRYGREARARIDTEWLHFGVHTPAPGLMPAHPPVNACVC